MNRFYDFIPVKTGSFNNKQIPAFCFHGSCKLAGRAP